MIAPRPHLEAIAAYALADMTVAGGRPPVELSQNECAWVPSPAVSRLDPGAFATRYPDPDWTALRHSIADVHALDPASILCGAGSMELIGALIAAYAGPGDEVLSTAYAYAFFRTAALIAGAAYVAVPEETFTVSVDSILAGVSPRTRIVAVANPGNPTGTRIPAADLRRLRAGLPGDVLLLIDEAYGEFADAADAPLFDLADRGDTVVLRTFSKAYALAGMRVGWGVFPAPVAQTMRKLLNPNNIPALSQAAAVAAMTDQAHMRRIVRQTHDERERLDSALGAIGIRTVPGCTNFLLCLFADTAEAARAERHLREDAVLVRAMSGYGLGHALRITVGQRQEMAAVVQSLTDWREGEGTS